MVAGKQPGHVVNTASMAGLIASQGLGIYNTTKYAVVGLSETLQKDLRGYDIGVSVLCPMGVHTQIRQSDRNRPAALRNEAAEREGRAVELIGRYLPPEHVAERSSPRAHASTIDADDMVWLTDDLHHTVRKFTPEGKHLLTIGNPDSPAELQGGRPFNRPTHVAICPKSGFLFVSDGYGNSR